VLQKVGRTWKGIEWGGVFEDGRCLVVDDPRKSGGVEGIKIRKRVGFSKGTGYSSMAVRLNTAMKLLTV